MNIKTQFIHVLGCRRSGTTFLGNLINTVNNSTYIEEPFNKLRGIKSLPDVWYPYINNDNISSSFRTDLNKFFNLGPIPFKHSINNNDTGYLDVNTTTHRVLLDVFKNKSGEPLLKRILRIFLKNKHYLSYHRTRISPKKHIIVKDALASLSATYLANNFQTKLIVVFRNPKAYFYSMLKQNWYVDLNDFKTQKDLLKDFPFITQLVNEEHTFDNRIINEWIIVNKVLLEMSKTVDIIFVAQEDLSKTPHKEMDKIFDKLQIPNEERNYQKIIKLTQGNDSNPKNIKNVKRNSLSTLNQWKNKLSKQQIDLIENKTNVIYEKLNSIKL